MEVICINTINNYTKLTVTNSKMKSSSDTDKFSIRIKKNSRSNFKSVKYLNTISSAKSQQQVRLVLNSLKKEMSNAKNCENYNILLKSINKVKRKAEVKIEKLAFERVIEKNVIKQNLNTK